jgi:hypothetical protein
MIRLAAIVVAWLAGTPALAECKLALALGLDISASIDNAEYRLQLEGLAAAIEHPLVVQAILTPEDGYIEAAVYEWSGYTQQDLILGWTALDSPAAISTFAARLRAHPRPQGYLATAIGKAVEFGGKLLRAAPACRRRILDVSGDGVNNIGVPPGYFYARGDLDGVIVNGLVILGAQPDPLPYYQASVIFGPGSFVVVAQGFEDYRRAMREKLIREITQEMILGER